MAEDGVTAATAAPHGLARVSVRHLAGLADRGELTSEQTALAAEFLGVSVRTMRRWLRNARQEGVYGRRPRRRFEIDAALRVRLAYQGGGRNTPERDHGLMVDR